MYWWKVSLHDNSNVQVEAPGAAEAVQIAAETIDIARIKSVACLSASASTRAVFRGRLGVISNHAWGGYREAERLLVLAREKYPEEVVEKALRLRDLLNEASAVASDLHDALPKQ